MTENEQTPERVTMRIYLKSGPCLTMNVEDFYVATDDKTITGHLTDYGYKDAKGEIPLYLRKEDISAIAMVRE